MKANWIWTRPILQWSLGTQSLFPPPLLSPLIQGNFRYAVGYPLSREATWRCTGPRIQHRGFLARMPSIRHTTKTANRTTIKPSSSISMKMDKLWAEQGVLSWIRRTGTLGAKQSGMSFGSAFWIKIIHTDTYIRLSRLKYSGETEQMDYRRLTGYFNRRCV